MAKNAIAFLSENEEITSGISELRDHNTLLKAKCDEIEIKDTLRNTIRKGMFQNKSSSKTKAINKGLGVTGAVNSYARKIKNIGLSEKSNISRSDLRNVSDTALIAKLRFIKELAEENIEALGPFGITAEKMNDYKEKLRIFENTITDSGNSFAVRKGGLKTIKELFKELNDLLVSTDKLADSFIDDQPEFVNNYKILRRIKKFGLRHRKAETQKAAVTEAGENNSSSS